MPLYLSRSIERSLHAADPTWFKLDQHMVEEQATWKMTGGKPTSIQSLDLKLRKLNLGLLGCKIAVQQAVYGVRKKGQH